jgi:hypothetical protein
VHNEERTYPEIIQIDKKARPAAGDRLKIEAVKRKPGVAPLRSAAISGRYSAPRLSIP